MHVPVGGGFPRLSVTNPSDVNHVVDLIQEHVRTVRAGTPFASCWLLGCFLGKVPPSMSPWGAVLAERFPNRPFYSFNSILKVLPAELSGPHGVNLSPHTSNAAAADSTALIVARDPGVVPHLFDSATGALRPIANEPGTAGMRPLTGAHADLHAAGLPTLRGHRIVGTGQA